MRKVFCFLLFVMAGSMPAWTEVLFEETFEVSSTVSDSIWIPDKGVRVHEGKLFMETDSRKQKGGATQAHIWIKKQFEGDVRLEFEGTVLSAVHEATDFQVYFLYSLPDQKPIYETFPGDFKPGMLKKAYHGYTIINFANTEKRDGNVMKGKVVHAPTNFLFYDAPGSHKIGDFYGYENKVGKTYRMAVFKKGNTLFFEVDGVVRAKIMDEGFNPPHQKGYIGIGTWLNDLTLDNVRVLKE